MADRYEVVHVLPNSAIFMTLKNPNQDFEVTPLFDANCLRNGTRCRHNYNEIL